MKDPQRVSSLGRDPHTQGSIETTRTDAISKRFYSDTRYLGRQSLSVDLRTHRLGQGAYIGAVSEKRGYRSEMHGYRDFIGQFE